MGSEVPESRLSTTTVGRVSHSFQRILRNTGVAGVCLTLGATACQPADDPSGYEPGEEQSGGDTTVEDVSSNAFTYPAQNMSTERRRTFYVGNNLFNDNWVIAPSSTADRDGLGPTFNAQSCSGCHFKDGRGAPPEDASDTRPGLLMRLSVPGMNAHGGVIPEPVYGEQLNPFSISGVSAEGRILISYEEISDTYADNTPFSLRRPIYSFDALAFGPMDPQVLMSPRVAPAMIGLGLLEAIAEEDVRANADPEDANGDGISGRVNEVWDVAAQEMRLGRFGWKANQPRLSQQTSGAFLGDIGITSALFPTQNCPESQVDCMDAIEGGETEIDADALAAVTYYSHTLAVPARRDYRDPEVLHGKALFQQLGCAACHIPHLTTAEAMDFPELSFQEIWPYTDLLLHDMGEGLADGRPDFAASGSEWRTPPLWGLGLVPVVNGHQTLLHDGRARNVSEAILWHGGEALAAQQGFRALVAEDRQALVRFLTSL